LQTHQLTVFLEDRIRLAKDGLAPVSSKKILKVPLKSKGTPVLNAWLLSDERLGRRRLTDVD